MAASEQRKPSVSRKSMVWQGLFVGVMLLSVRFLWVHNRPERLTTPPTRDYMLSGDILYSYHSGAVSGRNPSERREKVITAQSIYGGERQVAAIEEAHYQFHDTDSLNSFSIAEGKLYFALEPRPDPVKSLPVSGYSGPAPGGNFAPFLGTFLSPPKSPPGGEIAGQKRVRVPSRPLAPQDVRFRQVSAHGGPSQEVAALRGESFVMIGSHVFWIRPESEETVEVTQEQGRRSRWRETTARSDLMFTALKDGTTRCIYHGIPRNTEMYVGEAGVSWKEPAPMPGNPTLYYASSFDGSVRSLGDVAQDNRYGHRYRCVEAGNRLYWTKLVLVRNQPIHFVLMSANKDGSDIREVLTQHDQHPIAYMELHAYRGGLYCFLTETPTLIKGLAVFVQYLCRLHPDRSEPLDILYKMPEHTGGIRFEGGYAYLGGREPKRSLWAILTNDDVVKEFTVKLSRIPLDR